MSIWNISIKRNSKIGYKMQKEIHTLARHIKYYLNDFTNGNVRKMQTL